MIDDLDILLREARRLQQRLGVFPEPLLDFRVPNDECGRFFWRRGAPDAGGG